MKVVVYEVGVDGGMKYTKKLEWYIKNHAFQKYMLVFIFYVSLLKRCVIEVIFVWPWSRWIVPTPELRK